jgi:glycosyltransferase involved in cell wall biosynthesis
MTLGYLHVGPPEHGVHRYGAVLEQAARQYTEADVEAVPVELAGEPGDRDRLNAALKVLAGVDVCHVQYEPAVWGGLQAAQNVAHFVRHADWPFVVTLHDARAGYGVGARLERLWEARTVAQSSENTPDSSAKDTLGGYVGTASWKSIAASVRRAAQFWKQERSNAQATRQMMRGAAAALVCTAPEQQRLAPLAKATPLAVIPHFVEDRALPNATEARTALGLDASTLTVTVLGFIHRQKGHDRVVRALSHLPDTTQALFVGTPSDPDGRYVDELRTEAQALGVDDRIRITGYVDEPTLNQYLAVTNVAVCPFREAAASGSLSTWIAAGRPLVVRDLPLFTPYHVAAPEAIVPVEASDDGSAWAASIRAQHAAMPVAPLRNLQERLSLPTIIQQHMRWYTRVASAS